jgi:hypothetical protein
MHIANPKSFVAGSLVLMVAVKTMFLGVQSHATTLHNFNLVLFPVISALCFWHAFVGRHPLLGRSEIHTSIFLAVLSLIVAAVLTFVGLRYRLRALELLFAVLFYAAAAYYFREALREGHSAEAQNHS